MNNTIINVREAAKLWYDRDADLMSATVSYYALFAVVPLLLLSVTIVSWLYGLDNVIATLHDWGGVLGSDLVTLLHNAAVRLKEMTTGFSLPIVGILFFSGMVIVLFNTLTAGIHRLWGIPHKGFTGWLIKCKKSIVFTLVFELYLLTVIGFSLALSAASSWLWFGVYSVVTTLFFILVNTMLFNLAYHFLPWDKLCLKARLKGAFLASVTLGVVKFFVVSYLAFTPVPGLFGAAGVIIALLMWIYVFSCVFYLGAAYAKVINDKLC